MFHKQSERGDFIDKIIRAIHIVKNKSKYHINVLFCLTDQIDEISAMCDDIDTSCHSGIGCVDKSLLCDGVRHCLDGSDEWGCCK